MTIRSSSGLPPASAAVNEPPVPIFVKLKPNSAGSAAELAERDRRVIGMGARIVRYAVDADRRGQRHRIVAALAVHDEPFHRRDVDDRAQTGNRAGIDSRGRMLIASGPVVPLTINVSLAVGSPPLTMMFASPAGVLGLLRLIVSLPAPALIVSSVLLRKLIVSKPLTLPGRCRDWPDRPYSRWRRRRPVPLTVSGPTVRSITGFRLWKNTRCVADAVRLDVVARTCAGPDAVKCRRDGDGAFAARACRCRRRHRRRSGGDEAQRVIDEERIVAGQAVDGQAAEICDRVIHRHVAGPVTWPLRTVI